jgi:hypothetical protein
LITQPSPVADRVEQSSDAINGPSCLYGLSRESRLLSWVFGGKDGGVDDTFHYWSHEPVCQMQCDHRGGTVLPFLLWGVRGRSGKQSGRRPACRVGSRFLSQGIGGGLLL